tara:strand:- start:155 stop:736 length:582 start_codon:yes stop_codon:yes gene_type:complete
MKILNKIIAISMLIAIYIPITSHAADTNTVSSTVSSSNTVTGTTTVDKTPPTANAPNVVINNQDVCSTAASAAIQSQVLGIAGGTTIRDLNCERMKLSRSLYAMGMKVAAVSMLCQDPRVFNAMEMAGTPCPFKGKIGLEAAEEWTKNPKMRPDYEEWLKENKMEKTEHEWNTRETLLAIGVIALIAHGIPAL